MQREQGSPFDVESCSLRVMRDQGTVPKRQKLIAAQAMLAAALAGCGGSPSPPSPSEFAERYSVAYCGAVFRCCSDSDRSFYFLSPPNFPKEPECVKALRGLLEIRQGRSRLRYQGDLARDCLIAMGNLRCTEFSNSFTQLPSRLSACSGVYAGSGHVGDACEDGLDCAKGSFCGLSSDGTTLACLPATKLGESCPCSSGLSCDVSGGKICRPLQPLGGVCTADADCETRRCRIPPTCVPQTPCAMPPTCVPQTTCSGR